MSRHPKIIVCLLALLGFAVLSLPSRAEDDQFAKIAAMDMEGLEKFVGAVTASVGQDTLKLRGAADRGDCLELYRAANAFDLGYRYLAKVNELIADKRDAKSLSLRTRVVQSRVVVFAARVRAEEFVGQACGAFTIPAEKAGDAQFAVPRKIALEDFTGAVIEAREAAEVIYLGATEAAKSKKCGLVGTIIQAIQLIVPVSRKAVARRRAAPRSPWSAGQQGRAQPVSSEVDQRRQPARCQFWRRPAASRHQRNPAAPALTGP